MSANVNLSLSGSLDQLRIIWQAGEALLDSVPFTDDPEGTRYNILVSLQEMVTNVLRHAYGGDESKPLEVHFSASEREFRVELRDCGPAFNPLEYDLDSLPSEDEMPDKVGGYGIMIAKTVMDAVDYESRDGWNCLRMTKLVDVSQLVSNS